MSQDKKLYESDRVWNQSMQRGQINLLEAITDFFPIDTATILDVGCGDGKITGQLMKRLGKHFVGLDSSFEALSRCTFQTVYGEAATLPFGDKAFDLVITNDMLEHLPEDIEEKAWRELFRVADKTVMVTVPFREELLDGTAECQACGLHYHVNWHMRSYDWPQLISGTPEGWTTVAVVLTGESWSPQHPIETRFRRQVLDEWGGWVDALCMHCGAFGAKPVQASSLSKHTQAALGNLIYSDVKNHGNFRNYSEILLLYRRHGSPEFIQQRKALPVNVVSQNASFVSINEDELKENLVPYPTIARSVAAVDGGIVVQLPVYDTPQSLVVEWRCHDARAVMVSLEDGLGVLYADLIYPDKKRQTLIRLSRSVVPGYYGILARIPLGTEIVSVQLGFGPTGLMLIPFDTESAGYYKFKADGCSAFLHVPESVWINHDCISKPALADKRVSWKVLFDEMEQIIETELNSLQAECGAVKAAFDIVKAECESVKAECADVKAECADVKAECADVKAECESVKTELESIIIRPEVRVSTTIRNKLKVLRSSETPRRNK